MSDRLFISHASEDEAIVQQIAAYLEARGVPCWIAGRDIPPKSIYAEAITEGIETCSACVVVVSKAANASAAIKRELELASHYGKSFIPIRIDATEPGRGLDYYLRNTQWIDYQRERERGLDRIVAHLRHDPSPSSVSEVAPKPPSANAPATTREDPDGRWIIVSLGILILTVMVGFILWPQGPPQQQSIDAEPAAVWVSGTTWVGRRTQTGDLAPVMGDDEPGPRTDVDEGFAFRFEPNGEVLWRFRADEQFYPYDDTTPDTLRTSWRQSASSVEITGDSLQSPLVLTINGNTMSGGTERQGFSDRYELQLETSAPAP